VRNTPHLRGKRDIYLSVKHSAQARKKAASALHEGLGQHIIGMLLSARIIATNLEKEGSSQAAEASLLVESLTKADEAVREIIRDLDGGRSR
jgi:signal transduction histidine kinase